MEKNDPLLTFENHFNVKVATTSSEKNACYALRYKVYCQEFEYINKKNCENELEKDPFDDDALHIMITHQNDRALAGCARVLPPSERNKTVHFPFESHCQKEYNPRHLARKEVISFGELSRVTVSPEFRQRVGDSTKANGMSPYSHGSMESDRNFPLLSLSLGIGALLTAKSKNIDYLFGMMAPRLAFALSHHGIVFNQVGYLVDHHGKTAAYRTEPKDIWQTLNKELKPLLMYMDNEINGLAEDQSAKGA